MAVSHVFSSPAADFTGTVTVFDSAANTQTAAATGIVRPSNWNSAHNQFITLGGNTAGASTLSGTNIGFQGGNNVTLSVNASTIVFSGPNAQTGVSGIQVSDTTYTSGTITFRNANGISFGSSGANGVSASYTVPAPQTGISAIQVSDTTFSSGTITFRNANGISFGSSGANGVSASYTVPPAFSAGISGGNTSGDTGTKSNLVVFAGGNNITLSGSTNAGGMSVTISGANAGGAQTAISGIQVSDTTYTSGTVTFRNANGISFGSSGAQGISASYTVPTQTNQSLGIYGSSQTFGQSSSSTYDARSLSIVGSGGISVGWSNSSFLISGQTTAAQTNQSAIKGFGASNTGNTAGNTGISTGIDWVIAGSNNITISESTAGGGPNTLWISGPSVGGAQTGISGIQVSDTTYTSGTVTFRNANGISFGSSGAQGISASYTVPTQTNQTLGIYASSQTFGQSSSSTYDARSLSVVGSGGVSVGWSNSSLLISGQTTAAQTNQTGGIYVTAQSTGQSSSSTYDLRTLSIVPDGIVSAGWSNGSFRISATQSNQAFSAAGGSSAFQTLSFSDNAHLSFTNTAGQLAAAPIRGTFFAASNTTQSSTGTINLSSLVFAGAGIASVGITNGSVLVSVPSGGGAGDGGVFAGVSTFGNTAGSTGTVSTGNFVLVGSGPISLSQSTGAAGSAATITINAPATSSLVGASGINVSTNGSTISVYQDLESFYQNQDYMLNSQTQTVGQSTSVIFPFFVKEGHSADFARMFHSISMGSTSFASTANTSYSYQQAETHNLVMYSRGSGASSLSLQSYFSTSIGFTMSARLSRNTTNNISVSHAFTYGVSNGTSSISFSYAATNSSDQFSSTGLSAMTGVKQWDTQFAKTFLPGRYWLVYGVSTTQTTQGTNASGIRMQHSHFGVSQANNTLGFFGSANNASIQWQLGIGSYTTNGATTASINASAVSSSASHVVPYIQLMKIA